ncbi:MAG: hypothetical protein LBL00_04715 [Endomicrobium sp.]|nr:hypothetical protein [Endomicrobium sp.]
MVAGVLAYFYRFKTSGNKEEIYQADKKAAKLLGTPYNLISAFEKIIRSRGKRAGVIAALEEAFRSRIDGRGIYRYIPLLEKRMSLLSLAGFTVL